MCPRWSYLEVVVFHGILNSSGNIGIKIISESFYSDSLGWQSNTGSTSGLGLNIPFRYFTLIYRKKVFGPKPEVLPILLRDLNESL